MQSGQRTARTRKTSDSDHERDQELIALVLAGDESAFPQIYANYYSFIYAFVDKRIGDSAEAEDLTQETFVQVYLSLDSFQGRSSLRNWIFGIAHNVCLRFYRHCARWMVGPRNARELKEAPVDLQIERALDAARVLSKCDEVLKAKRRPAHLEVFQLRYGESHRIKAIAANLGKEQGSCKNEPSKEPRAALRPSPGDLRRAGRLRSIRLMTDCAKDRTGEPPHAVQGRLSAVVHHSPYAIPETRQESRKKKAPFPYHR